MNRKTAMHRPIVIVDLPDSTGIIVQLPKKTMTHIVVSGNKIKCGKLQKHLLRHEMDDPCHKSIMVSKPELY